MFQSDDFDDLLIEENLSKIEDAVIKIDENNDKISCTQKTIAEAVDRKDGISENKNNAQKVIKMLNASVCEDDSKLNKIPFKEDSKSNRIPCKDDTKLNTIPLKEDSNLNKVPCKEDSKSNTIPSIDNGSISPIFCKDNTELKRCNISWSSSDGDTPNRVKRKRKFPGPAGLLPETFGDNQDKLVGVPLSQSFPNSQSVLPLSVFDESPWQCMRRQTSSCTVDSILGIKHRALQNRLVGRKVPLLAGIVQNIDKSLPDPLLVLRDMTDEIQCTLHREAWEYLSCHLVPHSTVLVLRNTTVLTAGAALKKIYLNVTNNNILSLYCHEDSVISLSDSCNTLKTRAGFHKMYSEELIDVDGSRIVKLQNVHTGFSKDNNTSSTLSESMLTSLQETPDDIIAQSLLDGITDEFISHSFQ